MRAIQLTVEAFGPYSKKQVIDFTQLGHETVFLITGPTGAGKTSIFDAMVYALYGRASGSDRDQDTLRSHFAEEEQQTEVQFRFELKQALYEVRRSPKQMKKKERGEGFTEQPPRAELYRIKEEQSELLASKIKDVNEAIEDMLHLDYEQFRKMIMIPQGEFRRLISENSKEREEILQKIFQTYVYEQLTDRLKDESKQLKEAIELVETKEREEVNRLDWDEETIQPLSSEEIMEKLQETIHHNETQFSEMEKTNETKRTALKKAQDVFYNKKQLKESFQKLDQQKIELQKLHAEQPTYQRMASEVEQAKRAEQVKPYEDQVVQREQEKEKQTSQLNDTKAKLEWVQQQFMETEKRYEQALEENEERENKKELIKQKKHEHERLVHFNQLIEQETSLEQSKQQAEKDVSTLEEQSKQFNHQWDTLSERTNDSQAVTKKYYELESKQKEVQSTLDTLNRLIQEENKITNMISHYNQAQKTFMQTKQEVEAAKDRLRTLERDKQQNQAVVLAETLQDQQPCPVCGSSHHPQPATLKVSPISDQEIEEARKQVDVTEQKLQKQQDDFVQIKSDGQTQRQVIQQVLNELKQSFQEDEIGEQSREQQQQFYRNRFKQLREEKEKVAKQLKQIETDIKDMEEIKKKIKQVNESLTDVRKQYHSKYNAWLEVHTKRKQIEETITGTKDSKQLHQEITSLEQDYQKELHAFEQVKESYQKKKEEKQRLETEVKGYESFLQSTMQYVKQANKIWLEKLNEVGFASAEEYRDAKLDSNLVEQKDKEVNNFTKKLQASQETVTSLEQQLEGQEMPDLDAYQREIDELEQIIKQVSDKQQEIHLEIKEQKKVYERLKGLFEEKKEKEQTYYYIGELAQLAKGDNAYKLSFERYVLAAFLDEIILQANIRLDQMTEHRYQLERSKERAKGGAQSGLDLEVLDHYTGQKRSVKTLSGGEGFKAALSLALGMADVVQAHAGGVQLDTLFIDEGFGTLDEISLEQAIDCLKDLQKGNRMLGIISHVPQLKQEIPAKLQIQPSPQGSTCAFIFH